MAAPQVNLNTASAQLISSPQTISAQTFRQKVEQRRLYYLGLIEFCVKNKDQEGALILLEDFVSELGNYFKQILNSRDNAKSKESKTKALVETARRGFGKYLGCTMVWHSKKTKKFKAHYGWIAPFEALSRSEQERTEIVKHILQMIDDLPLEHLLAEHLLETPNLGEIMQRTMDDLIAEEETTTP